MYGPVMAAIRAYEKQGISDFQKTLDRRGITVINIETNVAKPSEEYLIDVASKYDILLSDINGLSKFDDENIEKGFSELKRYHLVLLRILKFKLENIPIFSEEEAKRYCRR